MRSSLCAFALLGSGSCRPQMLRYFTTVGSASCRSSPDTAGRSCAPRCAFGGGSRSGKAGMLAASASMAPLSSSSGAATPSSPRAVPVAQPPASAPISSSATSLSASPRLPVPPPVSETSTGWEGALSSPAEPHRRIMCNRSLNMKTIRSVGFDMDYTIAQVRDAALGFYLCWGSPTLGMPFRSPFLSTSLRA